MINIYPDEVFRHREHIIRLGPYLFIFVELQNFELSVIEAYIQCGEAKAKVK